MATFSKFSCMVAGATGAILLALVFVARGEPAATPAQSAANTTAASPDGKELFQREWLPHDPRAHGGDGLGPVFNDSSCVACHNQGGSGGGGPRSKNVDIITAFANPGPQHADQPESTNQNLPSMILNVFVDTLSQSSAPPARSGSTPSAASSNQVPPAAAGTSTADARASTTPADRLAEIKRQKQELAKIHPGFMTARSVVLHRFSTDEKYESWREQMLGMGQFQGANMAATNQLDNSSSSSNSAADDQPTAGTTDQQPATPATETASADSSVVRIQVVSDVDAQQVMQQLKTQSQMAQQDGIQGRMGNFSFVHSQRNPTALFGVGLIDSIPDQALIDQAKKQFPGFPEIQGRVAKMKDGKIGRFGWKDQKASLYEFAMTACAVELGLDVPDHPQAGLPLNPDYKPTGHDMDQAECLALVDYLHNLPAPVRYKSNSSQQAEILSAGEKQFAAVGCANCHAEKLGSASGIYSDLLLHDMGPELADSGNYGVFVPDSPEEEQQDDPVPSLQANSGFPNGPVSGPLTKADREKTFGALRQEWRTPPLWGVRDSGPYLHDGRAETLEQAIAFHGGEASNSAKQFFMLKPQERAQVVAFLKSLVAPEQSSTAELSRKTGVVTAAN